MSLLCTAINQLVEKLLGNCSCIALPSPIRGPVRLFVHFCLVSAALVTFFNNLVMHWYRESQTLLLRCVSGLLLASLFLVPAVQADKLETLIMPGKVIAGHAKYEEDCNQCHKVFKKEDQSQLCLDCHKDVAKDVGSKRGFHGRLKTGATGCKTCHTEHKGRDADIIKFDPQTFNHQQTDFPLVQRHTAVACKDCHQPKKKYREAPAECYSCHKNQSPHGEGMGKLTKECASCHVEQGWKVIRFDHDKKTKYSLTGKHKTTGCVACHANERYAKTPTDCFSCHRLNDVHAGSNGKECKKCHATTSWKKLSFDHDKDTDFPLTGKHADITCRACHKDDAYKVKLELTCISCHKNDDVHKGKNGTKCQSCHDTKSWKNSRFDHDKETKFKLYGKHKKAACGSCHKGDPYKEKLAMDCYSCHKYDDAHRGQQGKQCQNCHNENGWREKVRFDHDLTRFPLIGLHAVTPCEECHLSASYKDTEKTCNACHAKKDVHKQKLGIECQQCHNPNGWKVWRFDHDKQSQFKIDGAHTKVHCDGCHRETVKVIPHTPRDCIACHRSDDIHNGQFGPRCSQCHSTKSFKDIHMKR